MATNAAKELLELITSWSPEKPVLTARSEGGDPNGLWEAEHKAVRLLAEVEAFLLGRPEADTYAAFILELRRFVFAPNAKWGNERLELDDRDRVQLQMVSLIMESSPLRVSLKPGEVDALHGAVQRCLEVLDLEPRQFGEGANYLRYLLHRCLNLLEGEEVDLVALRHLSFEATGVAVDVAQHLPEERREPFVEAAGGLYRSWFGAVTSGAGGNLIAEGVKGLLGG